MLYKQEKQGLLGALMVFGSLYQLREGRWFLAVLSALVVLAGAITLRSEYYPLAPWESLWEALSIVDAVRYVFINIVLVALLCLTFKIVAHEIDSSRF